MKLIDCTPTQPEETSVQKILSRIGEYLPFLGDKELKSQEIVLDHLQRGLDNRYTLMRNIPLEGGGGAIPFILLGPFGLAVLNSNAQKGLYRAKEESWLEMNKTTRQFRPAHVNLLKQTQSFAKTVAAFLDAQGKAHPIPSAVLIFTNPGVHIDSNRPAVRLVLADGIDRLIATFMQGGEVLGGAEVKVLVDTIDKAVKPEALPVTEEDIFGKDLGLVKPETPAAKAPRPVSQLNLPPFLARLNFTKKQWVLLVVILLVNLMLLMGLIFLILMTTR